MNKISMEKIILVILQGLMAAVFIGFFALLSGKKGNA